MTFSGVHTNLLTGNGRVYATVILQPRNFPTMPDQALRILLVEDHAATAGALAKTLARHGFAVTTATSADAALQAGEKAKFDLLITDIGLPEKNGWELFRELRARQPHLAGIALTGYGYAADVRRSEEVGIRIHLTKPTTMQQIEAAIVQLFPQHAGTFADPDPR
jgi:DNA-binding response OmpR family regulator